MVDRRCGVLDSAKEMVGLSEAAISALADGELDAIRVPQLLDPAAYEATTQALAQIHFATYDRARVFPVVTRFGVSVNDHRRDRRVQDSYWPAVSRSRQAWAELHIDPDPFQACQDRLAAAWPAGVGVASRGGRGYSPGIIREIDAGLQVHFDDATLEFAENAFDAPLVAQFAFNLFLRVPAAGGELTIWRHRWHQEDEAHRIPGGYGYHESVVAGVPRIELPPHANEAMIFDPRNFHTVRPGGAGRRIALAFSIGILATGPLVVWA
jgi:hypothetical protein